MEYSEDELRALLDLHHNHGALSRDQMEALARWPETPPNVRDELRVDQQRRGFHTLTDAEYLRVEGLEETEPAKPRSLLDPLRGIFAR